ncbi:MAG TPA: C4-dicarboxylate ABC transporter [Campylobacterales bacterium]|nr:C4-dicarboxylate ABC transporter [Campylobacterales bacterium]
MHLNKRSLEYFPIQLFAVVMGLSGLTIVFAKAYHLIHMPYWIYATLLLIDTVLFLAIFILYTIKWLLYPQAVQKEFIHPIKSSFVATISISFLLVSIAYYDFAPTISVLFWYIGTPLQLAFTIMIMKYWIRNEFKIVHSNPAWFIPIVGNVLVPIIGVETVPIWVSVFFFALGVFFWLVLFTIMMYRIVFHQPLAKKLLPTLFILIAPPAVGFISYFRISEGSIDSISLFLYFIALFTLFLLLFMVRIFDSKEFFISWWAYTFPLAAITIATLLIQMTFHTLLTYWGSIFLIILTSAVIGFVLFRTIQECRAEKICIEEVE